MNATRSQPLLLAIVLATGSAFALPQSTESISSIDKINGSITAESGKRYGDLSSVNGSIALAAGSHARDVETVNGSIKADNAVSSGDVSTVNGAIRFGQKANVDGNAETVNGSIFFDRGSTIQGDISTVNGGIGIIGTVVSGHIETVNGDISVGADSKVVGGISVEKSLMTFPGLFGTTKIPRVVVGPNAVVEGPMVFKREVKLYVHARARIGSVTGATAQRYSSAIPPQD